ncbi:MAG: hypothetical protein F4043_10120 [Gammaproteobacteria bacterium]|nr:hypothetical protein [Gammaproteobacteria bacterium]
MDGRAWIARHGFWPLALLWLPAGVVAQAALRFGPSAGAFADSGEAMAALGSLAVTVPCGLPLALGCRRLRRLGYRRAAWAAGIALGVLTVWATVVAGLLGPVAIAICAAVLSLPVWIAWLWLARRG